MIQRDAMLCVSGALTAGTGTWLPSSLSGSKGRHKPRDTEVPGHGHRDGRAEETIIDPSSCAYQD